MSRPNFVRGGGTANIDFPLLFCPGRPRGNNCPVSKMFIISLHISWHSGNKNKANIRHTCLNCFGIRWPINCKFMEKICSKSPWNCSASFGTNHCSMLFWENPKTSIFMICGFGGAARTFSCGFEYTQVPWQAQENPGHNFQNYYF